MIEADREQFAQVVMGMALLYGQKPSLMSTEIFFDSMQDWDIRDFKVAAARLMKICEFMPRPKDFEKLKAAGKETAGEAFGTVRKWLKYSPLGYTLEPGTPRNIAAAIQACGGANAIAMCTIEGLPFLEKRFTQHFNEISGVNETRAALPGITGTEGRVLLTDGIDDDETSED